MLITLYKRPYGRTEEINIRNVRPEDAAWFEANGVKVSMEDCNLDFAIYGDCGFRVNDDPDEDPDEVIVLARGRSCEDAMTELRERCAAQIVERTAATDPPHTPEDARR